MSEISAMAGMIAVGALPNAAIPVFTLCVVLRVLNDTLLKIRHVRC